MLYGIDSRIDLERRTERLFGLDKTSLHHAPACQLQIDVEITFEYLCLATESRKENESYTRRRGGGFANTVARILLLDPCKSNVPSFLFMYLYLHIIIFVIFSCQFSYYFKLHIP